MPLSGATPGMLPWMILHLPGSSGPVIGGIIFRFHWCVHWGSSEELGIPGIFGSFPFHCALIPTGFQTLFGLVVNVES